MLFFYKYYIDIGINKLKNNFILFLFSLHALYLNLLKTKHKFLKNL